MFNRRDENTQHGVADDAILQPTAGIPNDEYDLFHAHDSARETWNREYRTPPVWFQNCPLFGPGTKKPKAPAGGGDKDLERRNNRPPISRSFENQMKKFATILLAISFLSMCAFADDHKKDDHKKEEKKKGH